MATRDTLYRAACVLCLLIAFPKVTSSTLDSSTDEVDAKIEYKVKDLMSPLLYRIMKATGHDFFVDGTVSANVKAEEFEFHPGKPRLVIFPPAIQTTTERHYTIFVPSVVPAVLPEQSVVPVTHTTTTTTAPDSTTTEHPCNTAAPPPTQPSVIGNPPIDLKRQMSEDSPDGNKRDWNGVIQTLKRYLSSSSSF